MFPLAFFNVLRERLLVQKQTIHQQKAIWRQKKKGVAWSGGCHAHLPQKTLKKKVDLTEESQEAKKKIILI